ncbi:hypothetical protein BDV12DRAFT_159007 [Aspergillus spectabilis]
MSFFRGRSSSSQSSLSTPENSAHLLHTYPSQKVGTSVTHTEISNTNQSDNRHVPLDRQPSAHPHPQANSTQNTAQFLYEDIDPPAKYSFLSQPQTYISTSPPSYPDTRTTSSTMLTENQPQSPSALPAYDTVSGSVIVDANGYPYFLTPQEERDRKKRLERAVHERMLGLPRKTDFSWEPSGSPVPPKYERRSSGVAGGEKGI